MRRPSWFLFLVIVLQLCLGNAWARAGVVGVQHPDATHAVASPPCHQAPAISQADGAPAEGHAAQAGSCCCNGLSHCPVCSGVGMPLQSVVHPPLPTPTHQSQPAILVMSWTHPPELRPPI